MQHPCEFPDPEARPSLFRVASRLPILAYRLLRWRALRGAWLGNHFWSDKSFTRRQLPDGKPIDIMVLVSDHYEPSRRRDEATVESVRSWCADYERMASKHSDSDGRPPQHTWFFPYDNPNEGCLREISASTFRGFGEVEFHLHHGHDTHHSFASRLATGASGSRATGRCEARRSSPSPTSATSPVIRRWTTARATTP